jgi:hypothetical protein
VYEVAVERLEDVFRVIHQTGDWAGLSHVEVAGPYLWIPGMETNRDQ